MIKSRPLATRAHIALIATIRLSPKRGEEPSPTPAVDGERYLATVGWLDEEVVEAIAVTRGR